MTTCRYINSGQSKFKFEYLGEFETEFENILRHESGVQVGSIHEKNQRYKISCYCPFKGDFYYFANTYAIGLKNEALNIRT